MLVYVVFLDIFTKATLLYHARCYGTIRSIWPKRSTSKIADLFNNVRYQFRLTQQSNRNSLTKLPWMLLWGSAHLDPFKLKSVRLANFSLKIQKKTNQNRGCNLLLNRALGTTWTTRLIVASGSVTAGGLFRIVGGEQQTYPSLSRVNPLLSHPL